MHAAAAVGAARCLVGRRRAVAPIRRCCRRFGRRCAPAWRVPAAAAAAAGAGRARDVAEDQPPPLLLVVVLLLLTGERPAGRVLGVEPGREGMHVGREGRGAAGGRWCLGSSSPPSPLLHSVSMLHA